MQKKRDAVDKIWGKTKLQKSGDMPLSDFVEKLIQLRPLPLTTKDKKNNIPSTEKFQKYVDVKICFLSLIFSIEVVKQIDVVEMMKTSATMKHIINMPNPIILSVTVLNCGRSVRSCVLSNNDSYLFILSHVLQKALSL